MKMIRCRTGRDEEMRPTLTISYELTDREREVAQVAWMIMSEGYPHVAREEAADQVLAGLGEDNFDHEFVMWLRGGEYEPGGES